MNQLARFDTSALGRLQKALIGFDPMFREIETRFQNALTTNYPPYNVIEHDENTYEIEIGLAGFVKEDVKVEVDQNLLIISGKRQKDTNVKYAYQGLAAREFSRVFPLAEHIEVGQAEMSDGILRIKLSRVIPEALKPRVIAVK